MSPPSGELFSFVSSVFPSPLSQDQFFLRDSFLILGHNTYDLASLLRIRLVCPAVYLYALDGYIKLNLSQVEVINPLFISFNLLGHCLHEEHCCPLHCWAIVLTIALTLKVPQPCFLRTLPSSCIRSPCFVPCPLPPSCSAQLLLL